MTPLTRFVVECLSQINLSVQRVETEYGIEMNEGALVNEMSRIIRCANAVIGATTANANKKEVSNDDH